MYTILFGLLFFVFCFALFALGFDMGIKYEKDVKLENKKIPIISKKLENDFKVCVERVLENRYEDDKILLSVMNLKMCVLREFAEKEAGNGYTPKSDSREIKPPNGGTGVIWYSLKNNEK